MRIPYAIISISKSINRKNNVKQIEQCFGYGKEQIKFYDASLKSDVLHFMKSFPEFNIKNYAKNKFGGPLSRPSNRALGEAGVWMSNMSAWKYMIDNSLEEMILFEDDCIVTNESLNNFLNMIKNTKFELYCAGMYGEAFYIKNSAAKKMLKNCIVQFETCPFDEGIYNMYKQNKIYSNGPVGHRTKDEGINVYNDIYFLQSELTNSPIKIQSEINNMKKGIFDEDIV